MIKAVIFDMDGLILDTEKLLVKYWCQAANEAGFPMQREHALNIRSLARKFAIPYLQGIFGENFDYVKIRSRRMELMKEHIAAHGLETKPGITTLLDYLDSRGIPAAIATATDIQRTEDYLGKVGLLGRFSRIVCAAMVESGKPKPDIYLYAAQQLGLPANEIVIPIIVMCYMAQGSLTEISLPELANLLADNGWTWRTAVCTVLFSLMHWPCSTSLLTIRKEAGGWKWAGVAFLLPTLAGMLICFVITLAA